MYRIALLIFLTLFVSCKDLVFDPVDGEYESHLREVLINKGNELVSYSYDTGNQTKLYASETNEVVSFDINPNTRDLYLILIERSEADTMYYMSIVSISVSGEMIELWSDSADFWAKSSSPIEINVSPDNRYLAVDIALYEGHSFELFEIESGVFRKFDKKFTEFSKFIIWDSDSKGIYVSSHDYLVHYDVESLSGVLLDSPNIRDYLSEEYLLSRGYVGERFDYPSELSITDRTTVYWNPVATRFVYLTNDSLSMYNLETQERTFLTEVMDDYRYHQKRFIPLWEIPDQVPHSFQQFDDSDIIVSLSSEMLSSYKPLNDNVTYSIGKQKSISYMYSSWDGAWDSNKYYFKEKVSEEKFHIAEFEFTMDYFTFARVPGFWHLVARMDGESFNREEFIYKFEIWVNEYKLAMDDFIEFKYPIELERRKSFYLRMQHADLEFHEYYLDFFINSDTLEFKTRVYELLGDDYKPELDNIFSFFKDTSLSSEQQLIKVYQFMNNDILNYYGMVFVKEIDELKKKYHIEELSSDWVYKFAPGYSYDYLNFKVYTLE